MLLDTYTNTYNSQLTFTSVHLIYSKYNLQNEKVKKLVRVMIRVSIIPAEYTCSSFQNTLVTL